jgi:hypothetical protein
MSLSRLCGSIVLSLALAWAAAAQEPLHERIDALIDQAAVGPVAPAASDADFLRRVSLDLTGVIPSAAAVRAFLADESPSKREQVVDRLLESPQFARYFAICLDVMLMERRGDKAIPADQWQEYLRASVMDDKPLDQLLRELAASDGSEEATRPAAKFFLDRNCEPHSLTRDLGRIVFGMDLQCAQCHDHPIIDDYYQADYYGLFSFVMRASEFNDAPNKRLLVQEKADGDASFKSVFTNIAIDKLPPQIPKGAMVHDEPAFNAGEEYSVAPAKDVRPIPKHSRRSQLAAMIGDSEAMRRNVANRLWAHFFGQGLVHPLERHHQANPPSHPALLTLLAEEWKASGFQLRPLVRSIVLTQAYQRSCELPAVEGNVDLARLEAERESVAARVEESKAAMTAANDRFTALREQFAMQRTTLAPLQTAVAAARAAADKAQADRTAAETLLTTKREQAEAVAAAATAAANALAKLSDDAVLVEASAKLAERKAALDGEVAAAQTAVANATTATETAAAEAQTAADNLAQAQAEGVAVETLQQTESEQLSARSAWRDAQFELKRIEWRIALAGDLVRYQELAGSDPAAAESLRASIAERWETSLQVARLRPLTAEQLAMSLMQATGALGDQVNAAKAHFEAMPPESVQNAAEEARPRLLAIAIEQHAFAQVRGNFPPFIAQYGSLSGEFQATAGQALFFGNGGPVEAWLNRAIGTLSQQDDAAALAEELYVSILTRLPSEEDKALVATHLEGQPDRAAAIKEMAWGLVSSSEFRFNH